MPSRRYFELVSATSNKFWEVELDGAKVITRYGKIGSHGQTTVKNQGSNEMAQKKHDKLIEEKTAKGYVERSAPAATATGLDTRPNAGPPRTSSPEVLTFLKRIGLEAELDDGGYDDFETVLDDLMRWYSDADRAAKAQVFAWRYGQGGGEELYSSKRFQEFSAALSRWVQKPRPPFEGEELVHYAADSLLIDAHHSDNYDAAPQLMKLESDDGTLYLLRPEQDRVPNALDESWALGTLNSPDTEAALNGIYRDGGCTPAFADHAAGCSRCQAQLQQWETGADLPDGFEQFRTQPLRPLPPKTPPLPPSARVGIKYKAVVVFPEPVRAETLPGGKPWWKLW